MVALSVVWQWIVQVGPHLFESGLVALAGAYFGAKTAQGTAARNKFRDDITKEIRDTNAAISLAFVVCNSGMQVKRQHLLPLNFDFECRRKGLLEHLHKCKTGEIPGDAPYDLKIGLLGLPVPSIASDTLRSHVLDRLSVVDRPLNLAVSASESSAALVQALINHNALIKEFREAGGAENKDFIARYFGLPGTQETDEVYKNTLEAMELHVNSLIYFTHMLCGDLKEHGETLLVKYRKRVKSKSVQRITEIDFSKAHADKLIPPDEQFASYVSAFVKRPQPPTRWERVLVALCIKRTKTSAQKNA
jgi:hypothetical protein